VERVELKALALPPGAEVLDRRHGGRRAVDLFGKCGIVSAQLRDELKGRRRHGLLPLHEHGMHVPHIPPLRGRGRPVVAAAARVIVVVRV
jgi:hypothetical protein